MHIKLRGCIFPALAALQQLHAKTRLQKPRYVNSESAGNTSSCLCQTACDNSQNEAAHIWHAWKKKAYAVQMEKEQNC